MTVVLCRRGARGARRSWPPSGQPLLFYGLTADSWDEKGTSEDACARWGLEALQLAKHPDKTSMGQASRGFVFLGYHFQPQGDTPLPVADPAVQERAKGTPGPRLEPDTMALARAAPVALQGPQVRLVPAQKTVNNFLAKCARLYEQGADADRIGRYRQHWHRWCRAGLPGCSAGSGAGGLGGGAVKK